MQVGATRSNPIGMRNKILQSKQRMKTIHASRVSRRFDFSDAIALTNTPQSRSYSIAPRFKLTLMNGK